MIKSIQILDEETLGKYYVSKVLISAYNYFLIELNKTYIPNLNTSSVALESNEINDGFIEIIISTNDEKMIDRLSKFEECIDEIYYLFIIFQKNYFKITTLHENDLKEISYNVEEKKFKSKTSYRKTNDNYSEWRLLIKKCKNYYYELEFISVYLKKLHCFNFHLSFIMIINKREMLNLSNFSLILPNVNHISEYFEKKIKHKQYFYNSSYLNFNSKLNKNIIYECFVLFHKSSQINFLELSFTIDRKITMESFKLINSLKSEISFIQCLKNIGINDVKDSDEINFEKLQIKTINDESIGIFINMNSVDKEQFPEQEIFHDILDFLPFIFNRIKIDNQFTCPNAREKKILKTYQDDIKILSNVIVSFREVIINTNKHSNFVKKFQLYVGKKNPNDENVNELLNNHLYKHGFPRKK